MWATLQKIRKMGAVTSRIARLARVWGDFGQTNFLIFVLTWRSATTSSVVRLLVVEDVCRCCRIRIARWVFSTIPRMQFNITCTGWQVVIPVSCEEGFSNLDVLPLLLATPLILLSRLSTDQKIITEKPSRSTQLLTITITIAMQLPQQSYLWLTRHCSQLWT